MAQRFLEPSEETMVMEDIGNKYLKILLDKSFLQNAKRMSMVILSGAKCMISYMIFCSQFQNQNLQFQIISARYEVYLLDLMAEQHQEFHLKVMVSQNSAH